MFPFSLLDALLSKIKNIIFKLYCVYFSRHNFKLISENMEQKIKVVFFGWFISTYLKVQNIKILPMSCDHLALCVWNTTRVYYPHVRNVELAVSLAISTVSFSQKWNKYCEMHSDGRDKWVGIWIELVWISTWELTLYHQDIMYRTRLSPNGNQGVTSKVPKLKCIKPQK